MNKAINRFCYKHPNLGIRNLMLYLVIIQALVFVVWQMDTTGKLLYYLYFNPQLILRGQIWRLITYIFIPGSTRIIWLFLTLYFYYYMGRLMENEWGTTKFTLFYICGVLLTSIFGMAAYLLFPGRVAFLTGTYINFSMFFGFALMYSEMTVMFMFIIPMKMKWAALLNAGYFVYAIIANPFPTDLVPVIAILNFALFSWDSISTGSKRFRSSHYRTASTINFKKAAKKARAETRNKPYRHRCEVCGRTDADFPNLQFRYCSRCQGYHCFCEDHINNHIHFDS